MEVLYLGQQRVLLTQLSPLPVMLTLPHANSQQESASMFVLCWEIVLRPPNQMGCYCLLRDCARTYSVWPVLLNLVIFYVTSSAPGANVNTYVIA